MNTEVLSGNAIDNTPEGIAGAFEAFLSERQKGIMLHKHEIQELKEAFYSGAQALLDEANPLSKLATLANEIAEFLEPEAAEEDGI